MQVYPHEAWCPHCHVSHPLGTRRCLHCGHSVIPMRPVEGMRSASATAPATLELPAPTDGADEHAAPPRALSPLKIGMNVIWVGLFIVVTLVRVCSERG